MITAPGRRARRRSWQPLLVLIGLLALDASPARAFDSWVERRDAGVIRQSLDYSCGLAALATVLTDLGAPVSEAGLLAALQVRSATPDIAASEAAVATPATQHGDAAAADTAPRDISFADLAWLARERGFRALGVAVPLEALRNLRSPAILAMTIEGRAHFSVLRDVTADGAALLADPSWGNRRLAAWELERYVGMDGRDGARRRARLLLLGPPDSPRARRGTGRPAAAATWRWPVMLAPFAP